MRSFRAFCVSSARVSLAVGVAAGVIGIARALSETPVSRQRRRSRVEPISKPTVRTATVTKDLPIVLRPAKMDGPRVDYFRVRRSGSALSSTYWILHGFGRHRCFILFDTWREAIDEALLRLGPAPVYEFPHAHLVAVTPHYELRKFA
jgi:hypothetical protein